jgi:hypothetical protein
MLRKNVFYSLIFVVLAFSACQKESVVTDLDYKTLGTSAHDLLSSSNYTSLLIQISCMPGFEPNAATLNSLNLFLITYLNKPGGIQISKQVISASGKNILSLDDIVAIEKSNRSVFTGDNEIAVHILITDSYYSDNTVFATSYWNTSICIFGKSLNDNSGGTGQITKTNLLTTLIEHEFGHLIGLVNQGSPMQMNHRDPAHGAHCDNPDCLMYYNVQNSILRSNLIPHLDTNCKEDLKANGGK